MRKYLSLLLALCLCALSLFGCAPASENSITVYNWEDYILSLIHISEPTRH